MIDVGKELLIYRRGPNIRYKLSVYKSPESTALFESWDLCKKCYTSFRRGVKKGVQKKDETDL